MLPDNLDDKPKSRRDTEDDLEEEDASVDYPQFQGEWSQGTSIFGAPVMSVNMSNRIINDFINAVEAVETDIGRNIYKEEEIMEFGNNERIERVEMKDDDEEFFQEVIDFQRENFGEFVGDRLIAEARYQTWNGNSTVDTWNLPYEEPEDLPVRPQDRRDKVWLHVHCYRKAPESRDLRDVIEYFGQFDDIKGYASPTPELIQ